MLEATFFGVMLLGRDRVSPRFYFFACCMVSLGTMFSSFWILANNSWMQVPLGHTIVDGRIIPADWWAITTGPIMRVRWPHMLLAAFLTTGMCVAATGAWYMLRGVHRAEARVMLHWGLGLVAVLIPIQLFFGHLTGSLRAQASTGEVRGDRGALEDAAARERGADRHSRRGERAQSVRDRDPEARQLHRLRQLDRARDRAGDLPAAEDRPPVLIPFFGFRIMVGMGLIMLAVSWFGTFLRLRGRTGDDALVSLGAFLAFPTGFIAILHRLVYTAEVGRQPLGRLRPAAHQRRGHPLAHDRRRALASLAGCILVYAGSVSFGVYYIVHSFCSRDRPSRRSQFREPREAGRWRTPTQPETATGGGLQTGEVSVMEPSNLALFWAGVLGCAILLYVILDGFDLGVWDPVWDNPGRGETGRDDGHDRAVLGWQRDLAGGDRRRAVCGVSGCLRGVPQRLLFSGAADAVWL